MISSTKDEYTRLLVGNATQKIKYTQVDSGGEALPQAKYSPNHRLLRSIGLIAIALMVGFIAGYLFPSSQQSENATSETESCRFCNQSPPILHHDQSYTILLENEHSETDPIQVTPMTVVYDYELYDGENIFALPEPIPNLEVDYAVLGIGGARNIYRETGEDVSLDEVYLHHFTLSPLSMFGAEVLNRKFGGADDPYMRFPDGYALHVLADEKPFLVANAHLLSNKNLEPIHGSLERAHKECNECYYAPGKGSECTSEVSGTFSCCGDSNACRVLGEDCACKTTTSSTTRTPTKYRIEVDLLVAIDALDKFERVDQWNFAAPACSINLQGDPVMAEDYPPDNYCSTPDPDSIMFFGGGSLFHQIPETEGNETPYVRTLVNVMTPAPGRLVWAQSHMHTGGINATLYKNGEIICTNQAVHGTNGDLSSNARNEQNHLVKINSCYDQMNSDDGIRFEAGDVFRTESYYYGGTNDQRFSTPLAAGEHKNVMTMFFTCVVFDGHSTFLTKPRTSFNHWNDFVQVAGL